MDPYFLRSVPRWVWIMGAIAVLGLGAWLRTCIFKIPPSEPYDEM